MRRTTDHDLLKGEIVVRVHVVRWPGPLGGFSKNRIIWFVFFLPWLTFFAGFKFFCCC